MQILQVSLLVLKKNDRGALSPATTSYVLVSSPRELNDPRSGLVTGSASILMNARGTVSSLRDESDEVLLSMFKT